MNHAKGYKLLNVIITRAKYKLYVCTSIPEEAFLSYKDLLLAGGGNNRRGVFYAYLAYAKAVSEGNDLLRLDILQTLKDNNPSGSETVSTVDKDLESPFEEEVYAALVNRYNEQQIRPQLEHGVLE